MECSLLRGEKFVPTSTYVISLKDMPLFKKETIKKLEHLKIKIMRNWAAVNGKAIQQHSNRQQTIVPLQEHYQRQCTR